MKQFYVIPYNASSQSARLLARHLNAIQVKPIGPSFNPFGKLFINWGCIAPRRGIVHPINNWDACNRASHKGKTYETLRAQGIPTLECTEDPEIAYEWLNGTGERSAVYARQTYRGSKGRGTTVIVPDEPYISVNSLRERGIFFTKRFPTKREFRVHVGFGKIIQIQEKKKRRGTEPNKYIRNHENSWVFCFNDLDPYPQALSEVSIKAVNALDLNFGALDIALDKRDNICVFEVNTAPGLTPTTAMLYRNAFYNHALNI